MIVNLLLYIVVAFCNVFLHILRSILVIKSTKLLASLSNCITYTFSAVVIKFIADYDLVTAICVQAVTNFVGTWAAMSFYEKYGEKLNERWGKKPELG